jgi:hypothetical protein
MTFEGGISSSGCAWDLALQESNDGAILSGTIAFRNHRGVPSKSLHQRSSEG